MSDAEITAWRSEWLQDMRQILANFEWLKKQIEPLAEFHIVIDANVLIKEILWLGKRRRNGGAKTALQESIIAGTIIAYVTPVIVGEVEEHLRRISNEEGRNPTEWMALWTDYKTLLRIKEPSASHITEFISGQDPDDAPTLALAKAISASGVMTCDTDIKAMGGKTIPFEFAFQTKDYSRKAVINVSIRIGGYFFALGTGAALVGLGVAIKQSLAWFQSLPEPLKFITFIIVILVALHPKARESVISYVKSLSSSLSNITPDILQALTTLAELSEQNKVTPPLVPNV